MPGTQIPSLLPLIQHSFIVLSLLFLLANPLPLSSPLSPRPAPLFYPYSLQIHLPFPSFDILYSHCLLLVDCSIRRAIQQAPTSNAAAVVLNANTKAWVSLSFRRDKNVLSAVLSSLVNVLRSLVHTVSSTLYTTLDQRVHAQQHI